MSIILYRDEFPADVGEEYCGILEESPSSQAIRIYVSKSEPIEEDQ